MMEIKPEDVLDMSPWWKQLEAHKLLAFAWIDDNFKSPKIQAVVDWQGERVTDSCGDYWTLTHGVRDAASAFYIDSSSIEHQFTTAISDYVMLKASKEKELMASIKRDKIERLTKELRELEAKP